jgi:hypothetical protein
MARQEINHRPMESREKVNWDRPSGRHPGIEQMEYRRDYLGINTKSELFAKG